MKQQETIFDRAGRSALDTISNVRESLLQEFPDRREEERKKLQRRIARLQRSQFNDETAPWRRQ